jgi:Na+/glutamate symporter
MLDVLVYVVAAFFAAMGAYALAVPAQVPAIFGVHVDSADGRNEVRAVYGGFGLAVAILLVVATAGAPAAREGILVAIGVATAGMAAGRLAGRAVERPSGFYPVWFWFWTEIAIAAALLGAAWA